MIIGADDDNEGDDENVVGDNDEDDLTEFENALADCMAFGERVGPTLPKASDRICRTKKERK